MSPFEKQKFPFFIPSAKKTIAHFMPCQAYDTDLYFGLYDSEAGEGGLPPCLCKIFIVTAFKLSLLCFM